MSNRKCHSRVSKSDRQTRIVSSKNWTCVAQTLLPLTKLKNRFYPTPLTLLPCYTTGPPTFPPTFQNVFPVVIRGFFRPLWIELEDNKEMVWKWTDWELLLFATAALCTLPAGQAFGTGSMVMKASVRLTSLQMCANGEKAKKTALSNGVALLSALCIGSSAGPLASRARDLSDGAFPAVHGDKGINLGYVLHPDIQKDIQKDEEPHRKAIIAVGAGAAGTKFFSEIFLLNSENIFILGVILYSTLFFKG